MAKMLIRGKLRAKPVNGDGSFVRFDSVFRNRIEDRTDAAFPAEAGRYHLYVSPACPWSHRVILMRKLKGLEDLISVTEVDSLMGENSWQFTDHSFPANCPVPRDRFLHEVYRRADPLYSGSITVPVLWDRKTDCIVSNESADIMRMLDSVFDRLTGNRRRFCPDDLRPEINRLNSFIHDRINNGVYRAGFARSQQAYDRAVHDLFEGLDHLEARLENRRYLAGGQITETDWRLFTTLVRFDAIYFVHFKTCRRPIADYPNLSGYLRDLYQQPGIPDTVDMDHIRRHYYLSHRGLNPSGLVPEGPEPDLTRPHSRDHVCPARRSG